MTVHTNYVRNSFCVFVTRHMVAVGMWLSEKVTVLGMCTGGNYNQQDRQCASNLTFWRVRVMIVPRLS